ncbi:hypothetical protein BMS97_05980 [Leuconostoc mesenteroides subsp. mesenteroides]|uniref:hypothetical protein n=1 Tax=Leuconostoc mesenteroides TaxID=1245 RepID=UPI000A0671ED|nr:hypothetical protein [Leuconostoc mesenteroides]ARN63748.1 hypothetical protein A0F18_06785 [Leuconostoc mesenteroides subsp. mesenteroides]MDV8928450.1 hypothetical protein [Leuconostoc mesenteroides]ORI89573.1 hypothetical protein BMS97_05980 [Leuconostoc mesenteroides subsp. mesenteroides]ORI93076.1 hypothetical protein BMS98_01920 [Leuconostoc mesenteroides subsp. mesenteroides]
MIKFGDWLAEFKDVDRPIGDLANNMINENAIDTFNKVTSVEELPFNLTGEVLTIAIQAFEYYLIDTSVQ